MVLQKKLCGEVERTRIPAPKTTAHAPAAKQKPFKKKTVQRESESRAKQKGWENSLGGIIAALELSAWHS